MTPMSTYVWGNQPLGWLPLQLPLQKLGQLRPQGGLWLGQC